MAPNWNSEKPMAHSMTDKFIIESFWQKAANCTSLVLIKSAIIKYGLGKVFKTQKKNGHILVTMRDKRLMVLSRRDIKQINRDNEIEFSRYKDPDKRKALLELQEYVQLCFAVIVRNLQLYGYDGKEFTQSAAIRQLTRDGMKTDHIHMLLGLYRKTKSSHKLSPAHLTLFRRKKGVLLFSDVHIVVASRGYYEHFGTAVKIENDIPILKKRRARYWFELK